MEKPGKIHENTLFSMEKPGKIHENTLFSFFFPFSMFLEGKI